MDNKRRLTILSGRDAGEPGSAPEFEDRPDDDDDVDDVEDESDGEPEDLEAFWDLLAEDGKSRTAALVSSRTDSEEGNALDEKSFKVKHNSVITSKRGNIRWLHSLGIGWCCKKGKKPGSKNQDSYSLLVVEDSFALYCIYDGHGPNGHHISDVVRKELIPYFVSNYAGGASTDKVLHEAFSACQQSVEKLNDDRTVDARMSGTSVTVVYHDFQQRSLSIAYVGDSRAVLCAQTSRGEWTFQQTTDHKPDLPQERERIVNAGGRVIFDGHYNYRVFSSLGSYPGLNMSRAIGDLLGQQEAGLSFKPEILTINLEDPELVDADHLFLLVCTDGVWEFLEAADVSKTVETVLSEQCEEEVDDRMGCPAQQAMECLAKQSYGQWMQDSDGEISDDITGILVDLRHMTRHLQESQEDTPAET